MRQIPAMTFRGALRILGHHDNTALEKLDALLGGAILGAGVLALTGPTAAPLVGLAAIWGWVDQKNEATGLLRKLLTHVSNRKLGLVGYERSQLVAAAHTALATSAVMDAFRDLIGEKTFKKIKITPAEQEALLSGSSGRLSQNLVDILYGIEVPMPSAGRGFEENIVAVQQWQEKLASTLLIFCSGLEAWNGVQADPERLLWMSRDRYVHRYYLLAAEVPEFMVWAVLTEHAAARTAVRGMHEDMRAALSDQANAMSRLESLLTIIAGGVSGFHRDVVDIVHQTNLAALDEPIIPRESSKLAFLSDIRFPLVKNIYVQPRYRCDSITARSRVADEQWWKTLPIFENLDVRLAAHLVSPEATRLPLLLLGHPGAGKSLLAKVLAARLPPSSFTAVYVPLRRVTVTAPIYEQVQQALAQSTHGRVDWATLTDQSDPTLRVILLDGLDELLQAAEGDRTAFLHEVVDFQRREADLSRPVVVVVTSRTLVADRVEIPTGTAVIKLEDFSQQQVDHWRAIWNDVNREAIDSGAIRPLSVQATHSQPELACQPLLLLMLALYSADQDFPPIEIGVSRTTLYRMLLENFALRESTKITGTNAAEVARKQLHQLSIAALAMFNRGRQYVTDVELGADLAALAAEESTSPRLAEPGQQVVAQFFFVYTAQAIVGNERTQRSYEFLHATFGEYLVAREVVEALRDTAESAVSRRGAKDPDDDLLFALLSHDCLATRSPVLTFASDIIGELPSDERAQVVLALNALLGSCRRRHGSNRYAQYRPTRADRVREIAAYSANLVLLRILAEAPCDDVRLIDLIGGDQRPDSWRSTLNLWRAGLDTDSWYALLSTLKLNADTVHIQAQQDGFTGLTAEVLHAELAGDRELALDAEDGHGDPLF